MSLKALVMYAELKELIVHNLDVLEFFDLLGIELADVIDKFDEEIEENHSALLNAVS